MILSKLIISCVIILVLFSCQSPTEIDVERDIKIEYKIKKDIILSLDTIDFGYVEKEAFYKQSFQIINVLNRSVSIKSINLSKELRSEPSYFHFDPLQNLTNIILIPNTNQNLNLIINLFQKNVGEFKDSIVIQTDSTYYIILKSIVPDIMVKEINEINIALNDSINIEINVSNYSNYVRKIEKINFINDSENLIAFDDNYVGGKWLSANSNFNFKFKIYGKKIGNYTPQIIFETQNGVISKNICNLSINVN